MEEIAYHLARARAHQCNAANAAKLAQQFYITRNYKLAKIYQNTAYHQYHLARYWLAKRRGRQ